MVPALQGEPRMTGEEWIIFGMVGCVVLIILASKWY